jgi:glutaminase
METNQSLPDIYDVDASLNVAPLFSMIDKDGKGAVPADAFFNYLSKEGILRDDLRLQSILNEFEMIPRDTDIFNMISVVEMERLVRHNVLVKNALTKNLIIPDFDDFCKDIEEIYHVTSRNTDGKVADYIPQLARVEPEQFAVSICTIDGQRFSIHL